MKAPETIWLDGFNDFKKSERIIGQIAHPNMLNVDMFRVRVCFKLTQIVFFSIIGWEVIFELSGSPNIDKKEKIDI